MTTTSLQLYSWGKHYLGDNFVGVFPLNRIPLMSTLKAGNTFIVNTQPDYLSGQHWIAVRVAEYTIHIFDPLGSANYPHRLVSHLHRSMKKVVYDGRRIQHPSESNCGIHCLRWLRGMCVFVCINMLLLFLLLLLFRTRINTR